MTCLYYSPFNVLVMFYLLRFESIFLHASLCAFISVFVWYFYTVLYILCVLPKPEGTLGELLLNKDDSMWYKKFAQDSGRCIA